MSTDQAPIWLTDAEQERFAAWLEESAWSDDAMAEQVAALMGAHHPTTKLLKERSRAMLLVANYLRSGEP